MRKPSAATILAAIALFVSLGGAAVAASGTDFILGRNNTAKAKTSLTAPVAGNALQINNTLPGGSALGLSVDPGSPPFTTNSSTKVPNLNSDLLDGQSSTSFLGINGTASNANRLDGLDSTQFLGVNAKAADSNKLDGLDSTQFVIGGGSISVIHAELGEEIGGVLIGTPGGIARLFANCFNASGSQGAQISLQNNSGATMPLLREGSQGATTLRVLSPNETDTDMPVLDADHFKWHGHAGSSVFTIDTWTYFDGSDCFYDVRSTFDPQTSGGPN